MCNLFYEDISIVYIHVVCVFCSVLLLCLIFVCIFVLGYLLVNSSGVKKINLLHKNDFLICVIAWAQQ